MSSLLRLLFCLSLALLTSNACRKTSTTRSSTVATPDTLIPGTFITSPGDYHGREGGYTRSIKLSLEPNYVSWTLKTEVTGRTREATETHISVAGLNLSSPADPWFVYVESPGRLWLWDGNANLYANFIGENGSNQHHQFVSSGQVTSKPLPVPKPVFDRLPESIRRILPVPETPVVKPSI